MPGTAAGRMSASSTALQSLQCTFACGLLSRYASAMGASNSMAATVLMPGTW